MRVSARVQILTEVDTLRAYGCVCVCMFDTRDKKVTTGKAIIYWVPPTIQWVLPTIDWIPLT